MVQFEICAGTGQWARFTEFLIRHRQRIIPNYQLAHALADVKNYILHGRGAILKDGNDQVIGIGSFVLGLQDQGFRRKEIAVLGNCYFEEHYQGNRTFVRGLQVLAQQIGEASGDVNEVRIPTAAGNTYTNRLYEKITKRLHTYESDQGYGSFHVYAMSFDQFVRFCSQYR